VSKQKNIILGVTASIAAYKACDIVRRLREKSYSVDVVMTEDAVKLIRPVLFQALSGNKVACDMFAEPDAWEIEHISLARKADLVLIAPATAAIIGKIAAGICDDMLTCTVCATKAPVLIAPAMNEHMYTNTIVQANIKKLKAAGYKFVGPREGKLACGTTGVGCLAEVDTIIQTVKNLL
jgi:phosphopantothenoylcysteine decarboxylase / phosphopantothenate---cysteine ligase